MMLSYTSVKTEKTSLEKPNVILIMADDMGYECLGAYGNTEYQSPNLDQMAESGMRFDYCFSQPLCTPSRVKIMTGLYNYRNYEYFGYLGDDQYTFGNLFQEAGYATAIAGKWQLNGIAYPDQISNWEDSSRPQHFGFDEYALWQLSKNARLGGRFANPLIEKNGVVLTTGRDDYGPDIFTEFILDFIDRKKEEPFFIYYPMVLVHDPFVPTPASTDWQNETTRTQNDTSYFKDMVAYTDQIVGQIQSKLEELDLADNTLFLFTGDNGTHFSIFSDTQKGKIQGAKGNTTDGGTRVPFIVQWPDVLKPGQTTWELIEFSDFFATFADLLGQERNHDGHSFLPLLKGEAFQARETVQVYYDPQWGKRVNQFRNQFVRTHDYKLYQDGTFYNIKEDPLESIPLDKQNLNKGAKEMLSLLESELAKHPHLVTN